MVLRCAIRDCTARIRGMIANGAAGDDLSVTLIGRLP